MTWFRVFTIVTACSMFGMVMGGLFGFASGVVAGDLFVRVIPWQEVEPVGAAIFFGATTGILLGGGLGVFALCLQFCWELVKKK